MYNEGIVDANYPGLDLQLGVPSDVSDASGDEAGYDSTDSEENAMLPQAQSQTLRQPSHNQPVTQDTRRAFLSMQPPQPSPETASALDEVSVLAGVQVQAAQIQAAAGLQAHQQARAVTALTEAKIQAAQVLQRASWRTLPFVLVGAVRGLFAPRIGAVGDKRPALCAYGILYVFIPQRETPFLAI